MIVRLQVPYSPTHRTLLTHHLVEQHGGHGIDDEREQGVGGQLPLVDGTARDVHMSQIGFPTFAPLPTIIVVKRPNQKVSANEPTYYLQILCVG